MIKVLLVDDSVFITSALKNYLEKFSFDVVGVAEDGEQGFDLCKELNPDIVIVDYMMPVMGGMEFIEKLLEYDPEAIIVVCSSVRHDEKVKEYYDAGAKGFISKPFELKDIPDYLKGLLEK